MYIIYVSRLRRPQFRCLTAWTLVDPLPVSLSLLFSLFLYICTSFLLSLSLSLSSLFYPRRSSLSPDVPLYFSHPRFSPRRTLAAAYFFPRFTSRLSRSPFHHLCLTPATNRPLHGASLPRHVSYPLSVCASPSHAGFQPHSRKHFHPPAGESKVSWPGEARTWGEGGGEGERAEGARWVAARVPEGRGRPPLP